MCSVPLDLFSMLEMGGQAPSNAMVAMNQLTTGQGLASRRGRKKTTGIPNPKRMFEEVTIIQFTLLIPLMWHILFACQGIVNSIIIRIKLNPRTEVNLQFKIILVPPCRRYGPCKDNYFRGTHNSLWFASYKPDYVCAEAARTLVDAWPWKTCGYCHVVLCTTTSCTS